MNACSDQYVTVNICMLFPIPIHKCMHVTFKKYAQSAGFEPARGDPNGFLVHRLNHSATTAIENAARKLDLDITLNASGKRDPGTKFKQKTCSYILNMSRADSMIKIEEQLQKGKMRFTTSATTWMSVLAG